LNLLSSIKPNSFPNLLRIAPNVAETIAKESAPNIRISPTSALAAAMIASVASVKNLAIGPFNPSSSTLTHANPLAPN